MPQDNSAGYGSIDPFGQFLMQAYLSGAMPGGQGVSNYNTVLDLLSPGALAQRQEQGVPNAAEYFANMFGGTNVAPEMLEQGQEQAMGLRATPGQKLEANAELNKALLPFITGQGQLKLQEQLGTRELDLKEQLVPLEKQKTGAQINQANSLSAYYESQSKHLDRVNKLDDQQKRMDVNIKSLALYAQPWDWENGRPAEGVQVDPGVLQKAKMMYGLQQQAPNLMPAITALLRADDEGMKLQGQKLLSDITGDPYIDPGTWFLGLTPMDNWFAEKIYPGGVNAEAIRAEIDRQRTYLEQGAVNPGPIEQRIRELEAMLAR